MIKKALITGITGQTGSYIAELLLEKGYTVHGIIRRSSTINTDRIDHLMSNSEIMGKTLFIHYGDVTDPLNIDEIIRTVKPDEIYNMAAQSHVKVSFELPQYTASTDGLGALHIVEAVRKHVPNCRIIQASTSEMFGGQRDEMPEGGYTEDSYFHPRSPYGCAKVYAYWITRNYREAYNLFACNSLTFNHESPRRGETFVTRKITIWCGQNIKKLVEKTDVKPLELGNIDAFRDWSHAKDVAVAQWMMLQHSEAKDYVIASGTTHTVREFIETCFKIMSVEFHWEGSGVNEIGVSNGKTVVKINPKYYRPSEVDYLLGNSSKIRHELGWKPEYTFEKLVLSMLEYDITKAGL